MYLSSLYHEFIGWARTLPLGFERQRSFMPVLSFQGRFFSLRELNAEHPAIIPLGLQLALADQIDKRSITGVLTPLSLLERCDIAVAQNWRDGH